MESSRPPRREAGEASRTARLLRAYHEGGDITARHRLVELYMPLVESCARRYSRSRDDYDDLYQVGCIGLIQAIDRFRIDRGDELAAFAVPNIAGEIRRYLRDRAASVRLPRGVLDLRGPAAQAQSALAAELGRAPTAAEVARELGADEQDAALALDAGRASQALELDEGEEVSANRLEAVEDRVFLAEAVRGLDERERQILYLRYVRDLEPAEIARELRLSPRQVSRSTAQALEKLRLELEGGTRTSARDAERHLPAVSHERNMRTMATPRAAEPGRTDEPYHIELVRDHRPGGPWTARVEELSECTAQGSNPDEAVERVELAMRDWIANAVARKRAVPKPRSAASYSGRLLVRMPQSLHAELARAAELDEVSLNQFITSSLASAVHWRSAGEHDSAARSNHTASTALRANLIVLGVVGLVALVLLAIAVGQLI